MNKRLNSILFVLAATVANIAVMLILYVLLLVLYARLAAPALPPTTNQIMLLVLFVVSVGVTYVLYHQVMKRMAKKYDLARYFGPIFGRERDREQGQ